MTKLVSHELNTYKEFLEKIIKQKDIDPSDTTYINIDQKEASGLRIELTNFLVSHFETMNIDKRLQVFPAESLYKLEIAYRNFRELKEEIGAKLLQNEPRIRIEREKTNHTLNVVSDALSSLTKKE
jgi:hypothetical protein